METSGNKNWQAGLTAQTNHFITNVTITDLHLWQSLRLSNGQHNFETRRMCTVYLTSSIRSISFGMDRQSYSYSTVLSPSSNAVAAVPTAGSLCSINYMMQSFSVCSWSSQKTTSNLDIFPKRPTNSTYGLTNTHSRPFCSQPTKELELW